MLRPPLLGPILSLGGGPAEGHEVLSQMCGSPACLDAPWAPANSYLLVAAALPEGAAEGYCAHGCFAFAWVLVSLLPSSPALEPSNAYLYRSNAHARRVRGISLHRLALCFLAGTPWAKLPEGEG